MSINRVLVNKENCTGCLACIDICPVNCISKNMDDEGFIYPRIDEEKCINCDKCDKVCPYLNINKNAAIETVYSAIASDESIRDRGSSGGVFESLAREVINNNGVVYGAAFDKNLKLKHTKASNIDDLVKLCKSKYLQSDTQGIYKDLIVNLKDKKQVLFVGTPCQVSAVKNYIGADYDNLLLVDFVCRGVPSQDLFDKYIKWEEKRAGGRITEYSFRTPDIKNGITHSYSFKYIKNNKEKHVKCNNYVKSPFYNAFKKYIILRPSCYKCLYATSDRCSDITLADFWGIGNYDKTADIVKGMSLVLPNTFKGEKIFNNLHLNKKEYSIEIAKKYNGSLRNPVAKKSERDTVFIDLNKYGFDTVADKYFIDKQSLKLKIYNSLPRPIKELITKVVNKIKRR